jgi:glycerol-3-phosphate O-acyltransferase / dihydroxyacetone phosphate acyltransferase
VLAKAPLFRHPLIGPFLWIMSAVPVNRRAEAGDDPRRNEAMFAAAVAALRAGGVLLIFPEGRTQPQPLLLPARTGAARIVLGAETDEAGVRVTLLPIGLVFHEPGTFRAASAQVMVGDPVLTADVAAAYRARPAEAVRELTARLAEAIRARIVEAEDQYTLELLEVLERAWLEETAATDSPEEALSWKQRAMRAARYLAAHEPDAVAEVRRCAELYRAHLDEVGITSAQLGRPYTARLVADYVVRNVSWLALGLPLAAWGLACHALPYWLTGRVVARLGRTREEEATDKMAAGLVLYPACWSAEAWLLWWLFGAGVLAAFALLLVPSGLLALAWHERLGEVGRQARALVWFLTDRDLHRRLLAERHALVAALRTLDDRVPPHAG